MAIKVKPIATASTKWVDNASRSADAFATEAAAAADVWQANTLGAKDTYRAQVTAPGIADRQAAGVRKAGAAKFARKILAIAKDRYSPGVQAAKDDYTSNVEPYFATLSALSLPSRKGKGDIANYDRVATVGKALHAKRLATLGVSAGA